MPGNKGISALVLSKMGVDSPVYSHGGQWFMKSICPKCHKYLLLTSLKKRVSQRIIGAQIIFIIISVPHVKRFLIVFDFRLYATLLTIVRKSYIVAAIIYDIVKLPIRHSISPLSFLSWSVKFLLILDFNFPLLVHPSLVHLNERIQLCQFVLYQFVTALLFIRRAFYVRISMLLGQSSRALHNIANVCISHILSGTIFLLYLRLMPVTHGSSYNMSSSRNSA